MARRFIIRIELTQSAKGKLNEISDHNGMTQVSVMSRMVEWFAAQPEIIQAAVLGRYPREIEEDVAKLILRRMASLSASGAGGNSNTGSGGGALE
jgi:hypothetical protein